MTRRRHSDAERARATSPRVGAWVLICASWACGDPPEPRFEGAEPAPLAARECQPPFVRFGPGAARLVDLDRNVSCEAWFERDACIIGIWDDCTVQRSDLRREWRGRITGTHVELIPLHVGRGAPGPRAPTSCTGTVGPSAESLHLACRLAGALDPPHAGLRVELVD